MNLPFQVDLSKEVVAITGAGGVLMSEFAKALAACGAKVGVIDLQEEGCKRVVSEIEKAGGQAVAAPANCLDKKAIQNAKEVIEKKFGAVTLLVNGAGGNNPKATTDNETMTKDIPADVKTFFDLDQSGFQFVFDLNILTAILCSQVFAENMVKAGKGNIINISSMNAYRPLTKIPAYSAAKAGVSNLTQWLAVHFAPAGIRCNAIAPGFFSTKQNAKLLFNDDGTPTARTGKILAGTPMKRFGETSDLIGTLLWLASPAASGFVTGIIVPVDGGFSAYSGV
jgi:NAD(P)-dependent dehydrogenase (short-subunit alcohol dehydrogenase family)